MQEVVELLIISLLQIYQEIFQQKNCKRLRFDRIMGHEFMVSLFLVHAVYTVTAGMYRWQRGDQF